MRESLNIWLRPWAQPRFSLWNHLLCDRNKSGGRLVLEGDGVVGDNGVEEQNRG